MNIGNRGSLCVTRDITWVNIEFRSENLLENGNKNRRNLPCGEFLLSIVRTRSFGGKKSSSPFLHNKAKPIYNTEADDKLIKKQLALK